MALAQRTDQEIVEQTNALARFFYNIAFGHKVGPDHKFYETARPNYHPQEAVCWAMACEAQMMLTSTDPDDALSGLEDA